MTYGLRSILDTPGSTIDLEPGTDARRYRTRPRVVRDGLQQSGAVPELHNLASDRTSTADGITPSTKISALVAEWLREAELRRLSSSTMRIYRSTARLHINPYMGEWLIREATTRRVDRVIKDHIAKGLDSQALRKHLNQVFDLAVRHDALPSNPVSSVAKVRRVKEPQRIVEGAAQVAEIRALVQRWEAKDRPGPKATHDLYLFVMLLAVTGVRPGELLAARWSEVNFLAERPYLEITGTIKQETGLGIYRQQVPKSTTSVRGGGAAKVAGRVADGPQG